MDLHTARIIETQYQMWFIVFNFPARNSPNLGLSHHPEVIRTGATYIPEGPAHSNLSSPHSLVPFLHLGVVRL